MRPSESKMFHHLPSLFDKISSPLFILYVASSNNGAILVHASCKQRENPIQGDSRLTVKWINILNDSMHYNKLYHDPTECTL